MSSKGEKWYVADFETTNYDTYIKTGKTRVWLYAVCDSNAEVVNFGSSIEEFFSWLKSISKAVVYFHNLKFDGSFIISYLLHNEYNYKDKLLVKDNRAFSTLIGEEGQYYQIKINFARNKQIIIQDSLKLIPLKVKKIAEAFNLPIEKEIIDYGDYTIDDTRLHYVFNDVRIVAMAMKFFRDKGFDKMTIGANSYNEYIKSSKIAKELFPMLSKEWLIEWRVAYRGGRSQVNPLYQGKIVHDIKRFDINSMYPYAMSRFPMPYGEPILINEPNKFKFELYKVAIGFRLKKGHLPTLLKKGSMNGRNDSYYVNTESVEEIYISNIDLELVKKHYDIYYLEYIKMYGFKTSTYIFRNFIDTYYELKAKSKGGMRLLYKLIINNLYGKFGSKCIGRKKIPYLEDDVIEHKLGAEEDLRKYYLPVAIAITSYCHQLIDNAICLTGYDKFVYCDTDSVHTIGDLPSDMIDSKEIGKFKLEAIEKTGKYVRQKCYVHTENDGYEIVCAGMTEANKEYLIREYKNDIFKVFDIGLRIDKSSPNITKDDFKLKPLQVNGGIVLQPISFSLN